MAKPPDSTEDPLVAKAFSADAHEDLARAVEKLSPEQAAFFLTKLEAAIRKRKLQITGYLVAMAVWVVGMLGALVLYGSSDGFVGWAFLIPFALVGVTLFVFGKWADRVGRSASAAPASPGISSSP